jgi:NitT/TauT family transport system substrate-binding protein
MNALRLGTSTVLVAATVLAVAGLAAAQTPAIPRVATPTTVKYGWTAGSMSMAGVFVAIERGYFKEANITTELIPVAGIGELIAPLSTGELDLGTNGPSVGLFNAINRGVKLRIVADQNTAFPGRSFFGLMIRKDLYDSGQVRSFADFKGKRFATSTRRTTIEQDLEKGLKSAGLGLADVNIITMGWPQINAALASKAIDVSWQIEPLVTVAVREGFAVRWKGLDDITPNRQNAFVVASEQFTAKQELARAWMTAYLRGIRDYNDAVTKRRDREAIIQILMKHSSVKDRALYEQMVLPGIHPDGEVNVPSIREALAAFRAAGDVATDVDLDRVVDMSAIKAAREILGPAR